MSDRRFNHNDILKSMNKYRQRLKIQSKYLRLTNIPDAKVNNLITFSLPKFCSIYERTYFCDTVINYTV